MKVIITGGAGFIGINTAKRFIKKRDRVILFDNLSRKGSNENLKWLQTCGQYEFIKGDVRNMDDLQSLFSIHKDVDVIIHLAAQVAVTTSVEKPRDDFEINTCGTFNILDGILGVDIRPIFLYASTNKVYGNLASLDVVENNRRYEFRDLPEGVSESHPLDFHSPYGCSKGAADQYVRDFVRIYNLPSVVLRQSCIYGYRQFGIEDQGWVAWFTIASVLGKAITIYGNGKQVRDVLFIDDLVDCYEKAIENIGQTAGKIYNIGGGPRNTLSLLELVSILDRLNQKKLSCSFTDWRLGDQLVFVSDIRKAKDDFGWSPQISAKEGVKRLHEWATCNRSLFEFYAGE